ncbi:7946_t:CDS:2, partial [Paraglomus occultum]
MEYSFLSREKFNQIVEKHIENLSKSDKSIVTEEMAQRLIYLVENNFEDTSADHNTIRWARNFTEEMYSIFCRIHNGDMGEGHGGQNATWIALNAQYCCFPQNICNQQAGPHKHLKRKRPGGNRMKAAIRKTPEGKPIISARFLQHVQ